jgi:hypothetical protein
VAFANWFGVVLAVGALILALNTALQKDKPPADNPKIAAFEKRLADIEKQQATEKVYREAEYLKGAIPRPKGFDGTLSAQDEEVGIVNGIHDYISARAVAIVERDASSARLLRSEVRLLRGLVKEDIAGLHARWASAAPTLDSSTLNHLNIIQSALDEAEADMEAEAFALEHTGQIIEKIP